MNYRQSLSLVAVATVLLLGGALTAADFTFGFRFPSIGDGTCPTKIDVPSGTAEATIDLDVILTTANNTADGAQGWSWGMRITGATVNPPSLKPITPPEVDPFAIDILGLAFDIDTLFGTTGTARALTLYNAGFAVLESAYTTKAPTSPEVRDPAEVPVGVVSAIVLNTNKKQVLLAEGTTVMAKLVLKVPGPFTEVPKDVVLEFTEGLYGSGEPVGNVVTHLSSSNSPVLGRCAFQVAVPPAPPATFKLAVLPADEPATTVGETNGTFSVLEREYDIPKGSPSVEVLIPVMVQLTTIGLEPGDGPQGWSFGLQHGSALSLNQVLGDFDLDPGTPDTLGPDLHPILPGTVVKTLFGTTGTPRDLDLSAAGFAVGEPAYLTKAPAAPAVRDPSEIPVGVVSAIVLNTNKKQVLLANATDTVMRAVFKVTVALGSNPEIQIAIADGLFGSGEPVGNVVTYKSASEIPNLVTGLILKLTGVEKDDTPGQFIRGDANDDTKVDIADVVWIVYNVIGDAAYPVACKDSADANDDETANLADAVYLLNWQFKGSKLPPIAPFPACGTDDDSTITSCPPGSTSCP